MHTNKLILFALLSSLSVLAQTSFVSTQTNFPTTENPISESGNWINGGATGLLWHNVQVSASGKAIGTQPGTDGNCNPPSNTVGCNDSTAVLTGTWPATQSAWGKVFIASATSDFAEVELRLRTIITANSITGYEINCSTVVADPYIQIVRWNGGRAAFTLLDSRGSPTVSACVNGDVLEATAVGSTITVYKNGVSVFSVTDATYTDGSPGIGFYNTNVGGNTKFGFSSFGAGQRLALTAAGADVTTAYTAASSGDTVLVPPGSGTWSSLSFSKYVMFLGAGPAQSAITLSSSANTFNKSATGVMRFQGFAFSSTSTGNTTQPFSLGGLWSSYPTVWYNDTFTIQKSGLFRITVDGHVFSHIAFVGGWDDSFIQVKDPTDAEGSWTTASTMGMDDTTGYKNIYIEDSTFTGGSNQGIDCDDSCRLVVRHNTFTDSEVNSHGFDTSAWGIRHMEVYSNTFKNTCTESGGNSTVCNTLAYPGDSGAVSNVNQQIWYRGGTGVNFSNSMENNSNSFWGTKPQVRLNIRAVDQPSLVGKTCLSLAYPVARQLGQSWSSGAVTDPIYFYSNTGTWSQAEVDAAGTWPGGDECTPLLTWSTFFQWGRDAINQSISGGSAKPGYTPYTYPHPLVGGTPAPPATPNIAPAPSVFSRLSPRSVDINDILDSGTLARSSSLLGER